MSASQSRAVWSKLHVASMRGWLACAECGPVGAQASAYSSLVWPVSTSGSRRAGSVPGAPTPGTWIGQIRAVWSSDAVASSVCDGSTRSAFTSSVWPVSVMTGLGSPNLHTCTLLSAPHVANNASASEALACVTRGASCGCPNAPVIHCTSSTLSE